MHRYTRFHLDMQAYNNFILAIEKHKGTTITPFILETYINAYVKTDNFHHYRPNRFPNIRKVEKMKYLRDLGFTHKEIGSQLGYPLHSVQQFLKRHKDVDVRHFKDHPGMDDLLKEWEPFRKLLPDDLFLKYTK